MWRFVFLFCAAATVFTAMVGTGSALQAESITYYLQEYPGDQNGWTLEGYITTNGTIGLLEEDDILTWSWTASKEEISYGYTSEDAGSDLVLTGRILADATTMSIPAPSNPVPGSHEYNKLRLVTTSSYPFLHWDTRFVDFGPMLPAITYDAHYKAYDAWGGVLWTTLSTWPDEMAQYGRVIGRVPEPGTLTLLVAMALCGTLALTIGRKRRSS